MGGNAIDVNSLPGFYYARFPRHVWLRIMGFVDCFDELRSGAQCVGMWVGWQWGGGGGGIHQPLTTRAEYSLSHHCVFKTHTAKCFPGLSISATCTFCLQEKCGKTVV